MVKNICKLLVLGVIAVGLSACEMTHQQKGALVGGAAGAAVGGLATGSAAGAVIGGAGGALLGAAVTGKD